jgi:hypothetical protein
MECDKLRIARNDFFLREHDKTNNYAIAISAGYYLSAFATNFDGAAPDMADDTIATDCNAMDRTTK